MNYDELRKLAKASPAVVFDNETESGRFYNAASPDVILGLLDKLAIAKEALEFFIDNHDPMNPKSDYTKALKCAREALAIIR